MGIAVTCSKCRGSFRVKDELAGKRGKCPKCQATLVVPETVAIDGDGAAVAAPAGPKPVPPRAAVRGRRAAPCRVRRFPTNPAGCQPYPWTPRRRRTRRRRRSTGCSTSCRPASRWPCGSPPSRSPSCSPSSRATSSRCPRPGPTRWPCWWSAAANGAPAGDLCRDHLPVRLRRLICTPFTAFGCLRSIRAAMPASWP